MPPPRAGSIHSGLQTIGTCLWQTVTLLREFQKLQKNYLQHSSLPLPSKRTFCNKRSMKKTAVKGTTAIHTVSGTIQPQHLLSYCQIQYYACEKMFLSVCVRYYCKEQRDTDCIHYVCTVLSTRGPVLPRVLKAVLINSFFKLHSSSNRPTAQETPVLLCTTGKQHLLLCIAYIWHINKSCTSAQKLQSFCFHSGC